MVSAMDIAELRCRRRREHVLEAAAEFVCWLKRLHYGAQPTAIIFTPDSARLSASTLRLLAKVGFAAPSVEGTARFCFGPCCSAVVRPPSLR